MEQLVYGRKAFKEARYGLRIQRGVIGSRDLIVPPKSLRKYVIWAAENDIHDGLLKTQVRLKL